jgi:hypothetical protein
MVLLLTEEHESGGHIWRMLDNRIQNRFTVLSAPCFYSHQFILNFVFALFLQSICGSYSVQSSQHHRRSCGTAKNSFAHTALSCRPETQ